ncbi:hypothetical protein FB451DRAFT_265783 [Mycena latifolia]|nr:hypothetical protein FB451DRAFT_265783 [Mycena latifolia]
MSAISRSDRRIRLDHLNQEIPPLKLRLKQLEQERSEIFESLTFPVLGLPVEVTTEIFFQLLPTTLSETRSTDAPLLLTRICRHWRDIAISTPELWSNFVFLADSPQSEARDYLINYWLSRSRHRALFISLYSEPEDYADLDVGKHASQWRDVRLCLPPSVLQTRSISFPGSFPLLEHLTIGREGNDVQFDSEDRFL